MAYDLYLDERLCALEAMITDSNHSPVRKEKKFFTREEIIKVAHESINWKDVSIKMDIGYNRLLYLARRYDILGELPHKLRKKLSADEILAIMSPDKTWKSISHQLGVNIQTLMYWANAYGITKAKAPNPVPKYEPNKIKKISHDEFMAIYSPDRSIRRMARELGITANRVKRLIVKFKAYYPHSSILGRQTGEIISDYAFMLVYAPHRKWADIAIDLKTNISKVRRIAKKLGLKKPIARG